MEYEANRRVETSARTFEIMEHLCQVDTAGVSALAAELGMNKGIVHNHLSTLRELGYVRKIDDSYELSPKQLAVGFRNRSNASLYQFGGDLVRSFAEQFDVGVLVCQRAGGECVVIDAYGVSERLDIATGAVLPLYDSLVGLVLALEDGTIDAVPTTAFDIDSVQRSLDVADYAVGRLSGDVAADCVAVPVLDESGACRGCIGVVLPDDLGDQQRERISEAAGSLRHRIEDRFETGWTEERSFATEKHTWVG